jgi:hypothetical protein
MALIVAMVIVGGIGRSYGPIAGTVILQVIAYVVRGYGGQYTLLVFSFIVLAVMLFARNGAVGLIDTGWQRLRPARARWERQQPEGNPREASNTRSSGAARAIRPTAGELPDSDPLSSNKTDGS